MESADQVRDTIYQATLLLDDQKWEEWLDLCDENFQYSIKTWSPEINHDVTYLDWDRKELASIVHLLPKHNTDHSSLRRHTTVYRVDFSESENGGKIANAISSVAVYRNPLDGFNSHIEAGDPRLFLLGRYFDTLKVSDQGVKFLSREVRLENRRLDKGSHWPI